MIGERRVEEPKFVEYRPEVFVTSGVPSQLREFAARLNKRFRLTDVLFCYQHARTKRWVLAEWIVPRHSFIPWLAIPDAQPTRDMEERMALRFVGDMSSEKEQNREENRKAFVFEASREQLEEDDFTAEQQDAWKFLEGFSGRHGAQRYLRV